MSDPNYHISEYLSAYLKIQDPDFAVMLTGPWGCGKTYFLNQFYETTLTDKDSPPIYISLNGINDTADIDMAIFQALHPFLGSKPVLTTKKILKSFIKLGFKMDLDADGDGKSDGHVSGNLSAINFDDFSSKAEGSIITFDDLERCNLPLESTLAYINDFVERSKMPVIIISDEKQLSKKEPNYFAIKEKIVGKTFKIESSLEKDYATITSITQNAKLAEIVERNKAEVLKVFTIVDRETGKHNYRSLRHCLRDFEFLFSKFDPQFHAHDELMNWIFKIQITLSYEFKLHHFSLEDIRAKGIDQSRSWALLTDSDRKKTNITEPPFDTVLTRHSLDKGWPYSPGVDLIFSAQIWSRILGDEQVTSEEVTSAFKDSRFCQETAPSWMHLWHWIRLEDTDAVKTLNKVQTDLKEQRFVTIQEVFHVFSIFLGLSSYGALELSEDEIITEAAVYTEGLAAENKLEIGHNTGHRGWFEDSYKSLGYWELGSDQSNRLHDTLEEILDQYLDRKTKETTAPLVAEAAFFPGKLYPELKPGGRFYSEPIFKDFEPESFLEGLTRAPNEHFHEITKIIQDRVSHNTKALKAESEFYNVLCTEMASKINQHKGLSTPSLLQLKRFKDSISSMLERSLGRQ